MRKVQRKNRLAIYTTLVLCLACQTNKFQQIYNNCNCQKNSIRIDLPNNSDQLIQLMHDSLFLANQKEKAQICYINIVNKLSNDVKYIPHYLCDFSGCSYQSIRISDSQAFVFRFDIRNLMFLSKFKDSSNYINKYYSQFHNFDSIQLEEYINKHHLKSNLNPKEY